jgi:hypothetical protein
MAATRAQIAAEEDAALRVRYLTGTAVTKGAPLFKRLADKWAPRARARASRATPDRRAARRSPITTTSPFNLRAGSSRSWRRRRTGRPCRRARRRSCSGTSRSWSTRCVPGVARSAPPPAGPGSRAGPSRRRCTAALKSPACAAGQCRQIAGRPAAQGPPPARPGGCSIPAQPAPAPARTSTARARRAGPEAGRGGGRQHARAAGLPAQADAAGGGHPAGARGRAPGAGAG